MLKKKPVGWRGHSLEHAIAASKPRRYRCTENFRCGRPDCEKCSKPVKVKSNCSEVNIGSNTDIFI